MGEMLEHSELFEELKSYVYERQSQLEIGLDTRLEDCLVVVEQQLQRRIVAELRLETAAALRSEASAVAALDEQLWLTDQRLGQRIDEPAHFHLQERRAVATKEAMKGGTTSALLLRASEMTARRQTQLIEESGSNSLLPLRDEPVARMEEPIARI